MGYVKGYVLLVTAGGEGAYVEMYTYLDIYVYIFSMVCSLITSGDLFVLTLPK